MKKNWTTRVAVALLALTMITSCFVGSTFAKYVTKAEGTDNARVAKWGILVSVNGDAAFSNEYEAHDESYTLGDVTVKSFDDSKVVAPGTDSGDDGLVGHVGGTPEVAVRYTLEIKDWEDIVLPAGTYVDYTEYVLGSGYTKEFTINKDYAPLKWDIVVSRGETQIGLLDTVAQFMGDVPVNGFSATEAKEIMKNYKTQLEDLLNSMAPQGGGNAQVDVADNGTITLSMDFPPLAEMDYTFALTWQWAFEGPTMMIYSPSNYTTFDAETVDKCDTYLGNYIAGVAYLADGATAPSFRVGATVTATATQID